MSSAAGLGVVRGPSAGARTARPEARSGRAAAVPRSGSIPSLPQTKPAPASLPSQAAARRQGTLRCNAVLSDVRPNREYADTFPRGKNWDVHKFGGTCMATAERIEDICQMIAKDPADSKLVVVSAMGSLPTSPIKVTDLLINMLAKASRGDSSFAEDLDKLKAKHEEAARKLLGGDSKEYQAVMEAISKDISGIVAMLRAVEVAGMKVEAFEDFVVGHGELWSARMMASRMGQMGVDVEFMDAREVIVVKPTETGADVDVLFAESNAKLDAWGKAHGVPKVVVCTGFVARNQDGRITTLKRNGSDYSATIMGALLQARNITIWTDVNGVYSADPRKVKDAECLEVMSYNEAWELAYFGANVLHPRTTLPAMRYRIPVVLRNVFNRQHKGTTITTKEEAAGRGPKVKGFATVEGVSLIEVQGTGMVGVPGTASAIFSAVRDANVNVIMISQASSEHSICFAVKMADADRAVECVKARFSDAMRAQRISEVTKIDNCTVMAAVGQEMASRKGISAKLFTALAKANVNVRATAQGASEYNITVVIDSADSARALKSVHAEFYAKGIPLGVALVGPGLVGNTLLKQLRDQMGRLRGDLGVDLRVLAIATSKQMLLSETPIDLDGWEERFKAEGTATDLSRLGQHMKECYTNAVVIDCTASESAPSMYQEWVRQGLHIITPNKKLGSGDLQRYREMKAALKDRGLTWGYETTVGAGLPVIFTLKHLVDTGDRINRIEGVFSGTMSYLFNNIKPGVKFSEVVAQAKERGYTEPDPRDDLEGMDVARKVVILAREAGAPASLQEVAIESLVPAPLRDKSKVSVPELMQRLPEFDDDLAKRVEEADKNGQVLRFVGVADLAEAKWRVELKAYPKDHPFAALTGADNIIMFSTDRYNTLPLIVRGPGAGAEVTAAGVFSDILRLAAHLGATM